MSKLRVDLREYDRMVEKVIEHFPDWELPFTAAAGALREARDIIEAQYDDTHENCDDSCSHAEFSRQVRDFLARVTDGGGE